MYCSFIYLHMYFSLTRKTRKCLDTALKDEIYKEFTSSFTRILQRINASEFKSIAYADDLVVIVSGYLSTTRYSPLRCQVSGTSPTLSERTKYLGIVLDPKLNIKHNVVYMVNVTTTVIKWMYTAIVRLQVL